MKIAFIGQKGIPQRFGGIEHHVEKLAIGLADRGHDTFVYTRPWYADRTLSRYQGVNLISLPSIKTKHFDAISHTFFATMHALFKDFDIIHYHGVGPAILSWIPRIFKPKAKVLVTFHSIDSLHDKWGAFARFFLRIGEYFAVKFPHETITVSKMLQEYCNKKYKYEAAYIPNGTEMPEIAGENIINEKFNLKNKEYFFIAVRLIRLKRIELLIEAFREMKIDKKLVIAGGSAFTDDYVQELKKMAADDKRIIFTGYQSGEALQQLYENAQIFIHPSDFEGLPVSVLEAMSYSVPVVVSDIPAHLELVPDELQDYLVFKKGDKEDLKRKLSNLLENSNSLPSIGQRLRKVVKENYNWKDIVVQTEKLYKEVLTREQVKKIKPVQIEN